MENSIYCEAHIPATGRTIGAWIDGDMLDDDECTAAALLANTCDNVDASEIDEILVLDAEGLASAFVGSHGTFEWDEFLECRDHDGDDDAKRIFVEWTGSWNADRFEDSYCGQWKSFQDYVEETFCECYEIPEHLIYYIDWEAIARDWGCEHYDENGHVFRSI